MKTSAKYFGLAVRP